MLTHRRQRTVVVAVAIGILLAVACDALPSTKMVASNVGSTAAESLKKLAEEMAPTRTNVEGVRCTSHSCSCGKRTHGEWHIVQRTAIKVNGCGAEYRGGDKPMWRVMSSMAKWIARSGPGDLTSSCNAHDTCYGNCYQTRSFCDQRFRDDAQEMCQQVTNRARRHKCTVRVELMYKALRVGGGHAFQRARMQRCGCQKGDHPQAKADRATAKAIRAAYALRRVQTRNSQRATRKARRLTRKAAAVTKKATRGAKKAVAKAQRQAKRATKQLAKAAATKQKLVSHNAQRAARDVKRAQKQAVKQQANAAKQQAKAAKIAQTQAAMPYSSSSAAAATTPAAVPPTAAVAPSPLVALSATPVANPELTLLRQENARLRSEANVREVAMLRRQNQELGVRVQTLSAMLKAEGATPIQPQKKLRRKLSNAQMKKKLIERELQTLDKEIGDGQNSAAKPASAKQLTLSDGSGTGRKLRNAKQAANKAVKKLRKQQKRAERAANKIRREQKKTSRAAKQIRKERKDAVKKEKAQLSRATNSTTASSAPPSSSNTTTAAAAKPPPQPQETQIQCEDRCRAARFATKADMERCYARCTKKKLHGGKKGKGKKKGKKLGGKKGKKLGGNKKGKGKKKGKKLGGKKGKKFGGKKGKKARRRRRRRRRLSKGSKPRNFQWERSGQRRPASRDEEQLSAVSQMLSKIDPTAASAVNGAVNLIRTVTGAMEVPKA